MFCNIIPLFVGLLAALLGGLIGWYWLKNSKLAGLAGAVNEKENHLSNLRSDLNTQNDNYQKLHSEHSSLNASLNDWQGKHSNLTDELSDWKGKYGSLTAELATLGAAKMALDSDFNKIKSDSSTRVTSLEKELADWKKKYADLDVSLKNERNELTSKIAQLEKDSRDGHDYWESRAKQLNDEKDAIAKQLQQKESEIVMAKRENTEGVTQWQSKYSGLEMQLTQAKEASQKLSTDWSGRYNQLEMQLNEAKGASQKLNVDWENRYSQLDNERTALNTKLSNMQRNMEAAGRDFENRETELETEIARLKAEVDKKPQGIIARDKNEVEQEQMEILERIKSRVAKGEIDAKGFAAWGGGKGDNLKRLRGVNAFIEKKMNAAGLYTFRQIAYLNNDDQTKLNTIFELSNKKFQKEEWVFQAKRLIGLISEESPDAVLARIRTHGGDMNFERIGAASAESKDNLQLINYVTAFDEAKLNSLGIFKYSQIANFNKTDVKLVNKLIEIEEGRIGNEDWVGQSNYLNTSAFEATLSRISGRSEQVEWSRIGRFDASQKEDLQVVSGIGQFIEQKLYALGIYRLEQIAKFNAADEIEMNTILELVSGHIQGDAWVAQAKKVMKDRK